MTSADQSKNQLYNPTEDPFGAPKQPVIDPNPPPQVVNAFHKRSDVDSKTNAQHHTLGPGHNQSSPGDHKHDGTSSKRLGDGLTISGSAAGNAALNSVITQLTTILGWTNSTTP